MKAEVVKLLFDVRKAASLIEEFCAGESFETYQRNALLRSAVERQFSIIGEAISRLARVDAALIPRIPEVPRIVAFRNVLIHGYANVSDMLVWSVKSDDLPALVLAVEALLRDASTGCE